MTGPLAGVTVIEVTTAIAGPTTGKILGDMGADVIKVENPEFAQSDSVRTVRLPYDSDEPRDYTWRFLHYNTSKRAVTLDLKAPRGKAAFERLVETADVVLENIRPGSMDALGIGWEDLHELNPELVYCSINGYGRKGPYANTPAVDTLIQGVTGFATQIGATDQPETTAIFIVDLVTAQYAAGSIAMALYERERSGVGQHVNVSMLDATVSMLGHQLAEYSASIHGDFEPRYRPYISPIGYYQTKDGYLAVMITQLYWEDFCDAIDKHEWAIDGHRYATNEGRLQHPEDFHADLEAVLCERTTDAWLNSFEERDATLLAAPVNTIDEMVTDPRIQAANSVVTRNHHVMGTHFVPNVVPEFSRTPGELADAPGHGEHTDEVLDELGYTPEDIMALRDAAVIK